MKRVSLNQYLDIHHPWSARLLGSVNFQENRNRDMVSALYDGGIWKERLTEFSNCPEKLYDRILHPDSSLERVISIGHELFECNNRTFQTLVTDHQTSTINAFFSNAQICELGCGIGSNLLRLSQINPQKTFYGGELSENAVNLGKLLGLDVHPFDYYQRQCYEIIRQNTTVITVHSIEQLPDAEPFIENLSLFRDRIEKVIHFEPIINPTRTKLLGLIRNRYCEINDYNRNLRQLLIARPDIEIITEEYDIFGLNPLNPTSILVWRFVD
jgi:hypothetical protein